MQEFREDHLIETELRRECLPHDRVSEHIRRGIEIEHQAIEAIQPTVRRPHVWSSNSQGATSPIRGGSESATLAPSSQVRSAGRPARASVNDCRVAVHS